MPGGKLIKRNKLEENVPNEPVLPVNKEVTEETLIAGAQRIVKEGQEAKKRQVEEDFERRQRWFGRAR